MCAPDVAAPASRAAVFRIDGHAYLEALRLEFSQSFCASDPRSTVMDARGSS